MFRFIFSAILFFSLIFQVSAESAHQTASAGRDHQTEPSERAHQTTSSQSAHQTEPSEHLKIDSIKVIKNWRTRDMIILRELDFQEGDYVTRGEIDSCMIKIYNIGNFARVEYSIDTIGNDKNLLIITAKDAFTIVPILSFNGNREDWQLGMGFSDRNFLGRNIRLNIEGTIGTRDKNFTLGFNIPRQLMYKNMSVGGGILYGNSRSYIIEDGKKIAGVGYLRKEVYGSISNPWHEDFKYRFSPDFGWRIFQHKTDSSLISTEAPDAGNYSINYLALSTTESIGYIQRIKHQLNGYSVHLGLGVGIGLDANSPSYFSIGGGAAYHRLFNPVIQWSTALNTSYTTSDMPSLIHYLGGNQVKGIITGEIYGKAVYNGSTGLYFTYLNRDWFAIEQSVYVNVGNGSMVYADLFKTKPLASVGTGLKVWIPMIPWLYVKVFFTYSKNKSNWFQLQF
jgi:outer membrane protein assembly factor BamA